MNEILSSILRVIAVFWVVAAAFQALRAWLAQVLLKRQRIWMEEAVRTRPARRVALIVPVKGVPDHLDEFLESVLAQDYPDYRVLLVTQSEEDPATNLIRAAIARDGGLAHEVTLTVAGHAVDEGQKVHNQLAALRQLNREDRIVAFADADIVEGRDWLRRLVTPLNAARADLSSGYRWFIPRDTHPATLMGTAINAGIAMLNGPSWHALVWGGSMAMTRETFEELQIQERLRGSLNDDVQISRVARDAGKRIIAVRSLLAPTPVVYDFRSLFEFGRRQYFQVRVYVPGFWWAALVLIGLNALGPVAVVLNALAKGSTAPLLAFVLVFLCYLITQTGRRRFLKMIYDEDTVRRLRLSFLMELEPVTTFLRSWLHLAVIVASGPIREITWAGIRYRVRGRQKCQVVSRADP